VFSELVVDVAIDLEDEPELNARNVRAFAQGTRDRVSAFDGEVNPFSDLADWAVDV
jgi:hypothetical protein